MGGGFPPFFSRGDFFLDMPPARGKMQGAMDTKERQALVKKSKVSPEFMVQKLADVIYKGYKEYGYIAFEYGDGILYLTLKTEYNRYYVYFPVNTRTLKCGKVRMGDENLYGVDEWWDDYFEYINKKIPKGVMQRLMDAWQCTINIYDRPDYSNITQDIYINDLVDELYHMDGTPTWESPRADIVKAIIDYLGYNLADFDVDKIADSLRADYD